MLNNPALEIVLGLVFIYALYSMFATAITELFSTWISLRAWNLKRGIKRMLDDNDKVIFSEDFFNQPEIRFLGRKRLWSDKERFPSYIKPSTFSKALLNTLKDHYKAEGSVEELSGVMKSDIIAELNSLKDLISKRIENMEKDKDVSVKKLAEELKPDKYGLKQTKKFIYNLLEEAGNESRFKTLAENWFNETMERAIGWYKKWTQLITLCAGLLLAYGFNVDTIAIASKLSHEGKARTEMLRVASEFVGQTEADTSQTKKIDEKVGRLLSEIDTTGSVLAINRVNYCDAGPKEIGSNILGCFITAIALSLGSPFWFDLLSKLVKLRGAGVQEKTNGKIKEKQPVG